MDLKQEALSFVNEVRKTYHIGEPLEALPLGVRCCAGDCPVAAGIGDPEILVHSTVVCLGPDFDEVQIPTPRAVEDFIRRFDGGEFPELDLEAPAA